jgi:hypothetical protein
MAVIEAIATTYLEADAASVTFSSLGSYEHLQIRISARTDRNDPDLDWIELTFNGAGGTAYSKHLMRGLGTTVATHKQTGQAYIRIDRVTALPSTAAEYGAGVIDIFDYANGSKNTTVLYTTGQLGTGAANTEEVVFGSGLWDSVAAVTSVGIAAGGGTNLVRGSEFSLYGLKSS